LTEKYNRGGGKFLRFFMQTIAFMKTFSIQKNQPFSEFFIRKNCLQKWPLSVKYGQFISG